MDYFFVRKEQFEEWIRAGELLEWALVYGDYKGIPKRQACPLYGCPCPAWHMQSSAAAPVSAPGGGIPQLVGYQCCLGGSQAGQSWDGLPSAECCC